VGATFVLFTGTGMISGLNLSIPLRHDWKILYEIGFIPCIALAVFMIILPES